MMIKMFRRVAAYLPSPWQRMLKRCYYHSQIRRNKFRTSEPEYNILEKFICSGNWVVDVGANVGHYTKRFSELAGDGGRVIAIEPVPETFALLAENSLLFRHANITLINAAVSDRHDLVGMHIPHYDTGLRNFYEAQLNTEISEQDVRVVTLPLDSLDIPRRVSLVKIDTEGHEMAVLTGMKRLISRDHPTIIVEDNDNGVMELLKGLGYRSERLSGSANIIFHYVHKRDTSTSVVGGDARFTEDS